MEEKEVLFVPQPSNWPFRLFWGSILMVMAIVGLVLSIPVMMEYAMGCTDLGLLALFLFGFLLAFLQRIHAIDRSYQSLISYVGLGLPLKKRFLKLPVIWRKYARTGFSKIKVTRKIADTGKDYKNGIHTLEILLGSKWIPLGSSNSLDDIFESAHEICNFLRVPIEDETSHS
jgi:hypothetical protein